MPVADQSKTDGNRNLTWNPINICPHYSTGVQVKRKVTTTSSFIENTFELQIWWKKRKRFQNHISELILQFGIFNAFLCLQNWKRTKTKMVMKILPTKLKLYSKNVRINKSVIKKNYSIWRIIMRKAQIRSRQIFNIFGLILILNLNP